MPKHFGVKNLKNLECINKEFLEHLLVILQTVLQNVWFIHQDYSGIILTPERLV
jgi:hypothetical protein